MQFIRIAHDRPGLLLYFLNRGRIQRPDLAGQLSWQRAPHLHGPRPPLFQRRIVEKGIGVGIQDLVRERGRHRRIDRHTTDDPGFNLLEERGQSVEIHRLGETVPQGLVHERMIRNLASPFADHIILTGHRIREDGAKKIFRLHPLDLRRNLFPMRKAQQDQRTADIPAPARHKHRRLEHGGKQHLAKRPTLQEPEHRRERKAVLLPQRDHDPVVGRRGLQFEIEGHTEPLPQGEAPSPIDPRPEGRVQDQLHPAAFIEEPLRHDRLLCRHRSKHRLARQHIFDGLLCPALIQRALLTQPLNG